MLSIKRDSVKHPPAMVDRVASRDVHFRIIMYLRIIPNPKSIKWPSVLFCYQFGTELLDYCKTKKSNTVFHFKECIASRRITTKNHMIIGYSHSEKIYYLQFSFTTKLNPKNGTGSLGFGVLKWTSLVASSFDSTTVWSVCCLLAGIT